MGGSSYVPSSRSSYTSAYGRRDLSSSTYGSSASRLRTSEISSRERESTVRIPSTTTDRYGLSNRRNLTGSSRLSSNATSNMTYGSSSRLLSSGSEDMPSSLSSRISAMRRTSYGSSYTSPSPNREARPAKPSPEDLAKINVHPKGTCDRCDGPHLTEVCPIFTKPRGAGFAENHRDSVRGKPPSIGDVGGDNFILRSARVIPQPGDGSCLFHSLGYGMGGRASAREIRRDICNFVERNGDLVIADSPLQEWIKWDGGGSVSSYARRMSIGGWGGGIEMAAFSQMKRVNVHVYEKCSSGYKRISAFNVPGASQTVKVLYRGGVHYDALE